MSSPDLITPAPIEYLRGYRAFRQDPEWLSKSFVGGALILSTMCIPLVGQLALVGFQALVMRKAVRGIEAPLPRLDFNFDYLGKLLGVGFKGFIVRLLWTLPLIVIGVALGVCMYAAIFAVAIGAAEGGGGAVGGIAGLVCVAGTVFVLSFVMLLLSIPANVAAMRAELTDDMNSGLVFREVVDFSKRQWKPLLGGMILLQLVATPLLLLGLLLCYVGAFPVIVVNLVAQAHLMAQIYLRDVAAGGPELRVAVDEL